MQVRTLQLHMFSKRTTRLLLVVFCVLIGAYIFFVSQTIQQVVERRELQANISTLGSHVSELEFTYITYKDSITPEHAYNNGFLEPTKVTYVSRTPTGAVVTLNR